jgi:hypothetical protein
MLNFKNSYFWINPADPQIFVYDLVLVKGPPCVVKFLKELIEALIVDLDALNLAIKIILKRCRPPFSFLHIKIGACF